jgi:hypothetical protein
VRDQGEEVEVFCQPCFTNSLYDYRLSPFFYTLFFLLLLTISYNTVEHKQYKFRLY